MPLANVDEDADGAKKTTRAKKKVFSHPYATLYTRLAGGYSRLLSRSSAHLSVQNYARADDSELEAMETERGVEL